MVPSSAKFIAACDGHPRGWHGDPPAARRHMLRPQADACDVQFSTPELTLGALECSAAVARRPSYENERQNPYRALSVLDLVRHSRSHFSGPIQSNESRVMGIPERPLLACAVQRRRFPVGENPTRQSLQPEAIGAVMEVTKWLKPSISASRIGDSASVQAATRVNVEQASKRTMCRLTRRPYRGRLNGHIGEG